MHQQLKERLAALKTEYDKGDIRVRRLEAELVSLRETMLRISGAILLLQELLSSPAPAEIGSSDENAGKTAQSEHLGPDC
jgi:predicted nuclease with TOPRIM domain